MASLIDNIATMAKQVAIDTIRSRQPTLDVFAFFEDPEKMVARINNYVLSSMQCVEFLKEHAPEKVEKHGLKVLTAVLSGGAACVLFAKVVLETLAGMLFGCLIFSFPQVISLLLAVGGAYVSIELMRDVDANLRYDAIIAGFLTAFT